MNSKQSMFTGHMYWNCETLARCSFLQPLTQTIQNISDKSFSDMHD